MATPKSNTQKDKTVSTVPFDPSKVKPLKKVTLPFLKQEDETEYYVKITSEFYLGKDIDGKSAVGDEAEHKKDQKRQPPYLVRIINLMSNEEMEMIANATLKANLEEAYPDGSYVGKCFEIVRHNLQGKTYKGYDITEIADPEND